MPSILPIVIRPYRHPAGTARNVGAAAASRRHVVKERMLQRVVRGDPTRRIVLQHLREQVDPRGVKRRHESRKSVRRGRIPRQVGVVFRQVDDAGVVGAGGRAEETEDALELIPLRCSRDEGTAVRHLREYATHAPHVHRRAVPPGTHQHVRRAVPQGDDLVRVRPHGYPERAREAEIRELQLPLPIDE